MLKYYKTQSPLTKPLVRLFWKNAFFLCLLLKLTLTHVIILVNNSKICMSSYYYCTTLKSAY